MSVHIQLPKPLVTTKYSSRGSIYQTEFGSEVSSEDIAGGVSLYVKDGATSTKLCKSGRFIVTNLRLIFLPPVDTSVSKATSSLAWALPLQEVAYAQITHHKSSLFASEKEFLTVHTKVQLQFSFNFAHVAGVVPVHIQRIKQRVDEALAVMQAKLQQLQQQQQQQHSSTDTRDVRSSSFPLFTPQLSTPVPSSSSSHRPLPPACLLPAPMPVRAEASLILAPATPLPRCLCACACHCTTPLLPLPPPPFVSTNPLPPPHSPSLPQAPANSLTCERLCSSHHSPLPLPRLR